MERFNEILDAIDGFVWGIPLIVLIMAVGIILTIRTGGVQFKFFGKAFKLIFKNDKSGRHGEVSSFGALCTALSATIGTGNIVGVATAICAGGPGALFWMWIAALLGTATKYAECMLANKFRKVADDGHVLGGPFYYIENGLGAKWKWLGKLFAIFGLLAGVLGIGTITQVNGIASAVKNFFDPEMTHSVQLFGMDYSITTVIAAVVVAAATAFVIIRGVKRIAKVSEVIVPVMAILYFVTTIAILIFNASALPSAFVEIFESAFGLRAAAGGALGAMFAAMTKGVARGIFSNEAGLGSAPIAAAAAKSENAVEQGLVNMTGTIIDTLIICTLTGLSIVVTGAHNVAGLEGAAVTDYAFTNGLPLPDGVCSCLLMLCLAFFAFTTILGWAYYSEKCLEYLIGDKKGALLTYKWIYTLAVLIGPFLTVSAVWTIADIFNGLMALPNLIALVGLSGVVALETKAYKKAKEQ